MENERMPPLVFRSPLGKSPTSSMDASASFPPAMHHIAFTQEDGLSADEEVTYHMADREQRQDFVKNIGHLALRMRPRSSKQKLFWALEVLCDYDDCALAIAQQLPALVQAAGALTSSSFTNLRPLVLQLCCNLDNAVIIEATEAIRQIFVIADPDCVQRVLCPMVEALASSRWTAPKSVGAALLVEIAQRTKVVGQQDRVRDDYVRCCRDASVQVRRAACRNLNVWISVVDPQLRPSFIFPLFHSFLTEEQHDTIQIELVSQVVLAANAIGRYDATKYLMHVFHSLCCHRSWRVRFTATTQMASFVQLILRPEELVDDLLSLAEDEEVEIVAGVLRQLHALMHCLPMSIVEERLVPHSRVWLASDVISVRIAIAMSMYSLVLRCSSSVAEELLVALLHLTLDANQTVQITALSSLCRLADFSVEHPQALEQIIETLTVASASERWRLRAVVVDQLSHFSTSLPVDSFHPLCALIAKLVVDGVAAVRKAALSTLGVVARQYGPMWSADMFCYLVESDAFSSSSLQTSFGTRVVAAHCIGALLPIAGGIHPVAAASLRRRVETHAVKMLSDFASDSVSNVRVALARTVLLLRTCRCTIAEAVQENVHATLSADSDCDVVRAANTIADAPF